MKVEKKTKKIRSKHVLPFDLITNEINSVEDKLVLYEIVPVLY